MDVLAFLACAVIMSIPMTWLINRWQNFLVPPTVRMVQVVVGPSQKSLYSLGRDDPYPPGTRVVRQNTPDAHEPDPPKEYGVVVHSWWDDELGVQDYLVAFFGTEGFPTGPVSHYPYVLRYAHTSLRLA
jgi:hypothetical protein